MLFCKTQCLLVRACQLPPDFLPVNAISTCMSGISMHWSLFGNWSTTVDLLALSRPTSLYSVTWMTLKLSTSSMCILSGKCRDFCCILLYFFFLFTFVSRLELLSSRRLQFLTFLKFVAKIEIFWKKHIEAWKMKDPAWWYNIVEEWILA